jgi:hypothetical protein
MFSSTRVSFGTVVSAMWASWRGSSRRHRRTPIRHRLRFERLEGRTLLSGVTTQAALIAAINAANAAGGAHSVALGADITLYEPTVNNSNDGPNGLPYITPGDNLTIVGNGHVIQRSTSSSDAAFRLFDVASGASLNLNNMSLENGRVSGPTAATLQGGAIFVESGGNLNLNRVTLSGNSVNNAGSASQSTLQGGAIYNAGTATIVASSVTGNSAAFSLTNAAGQGDSQGDNDALANDGNDNGNGLIGDVVVEGGGIYNAGSLSITSSSLISHNSATSAVTNGSNSPPGNIGNGNSNGDTDTGSSDGGDNGNGISGNVTVEGGGVYNAGTASLAGASVLGNWASSTVTNGSDNGDNNGQGDSGDNNGDLNGNGVTGNVTVAGGGIYNFNALTATSITMSANYAASVVANGSNNGVNNGVHTENFDGNDNGNGVDGNIIVAGGGIANGASGQATIASSNVSGNWVSSSITNGNNNGDGDGENNAGLGNNEGKNNGNGVVGTVNLSGGGLDNDSGGALALGYSVVSANSAKSSVINGNNNGDADGNNDGDGDGLASALTVHGGGIRNAGTLTVTHTTLSGNSAASSISNGNGDGDNVGNNNGESHDGRADGNCVSGDVLVAGGGIANSGTLTVANSVVRLNSLKSSISNGTNNGDHDGQSDGSNDDCGNNCGNGVGGNVEVDGGGIGNSGTAAVTSCSIGGNSAASTVTNGAGSGVSDGGGSPASTGSDGQGDGNGVNGNVEVIGGGTANVGTLTLVSSTVAGNSISSNPASGGGNTTLDGMVVNGTVSVSGPDVF